MKKVLLIVLTSAICFGLSSCGMTEDLTRRCGGYLDGMCDFIFGNDPDDIDDLDDRLSNLEKKIEGLYQLIDERLVTDSYLQDKINELESDSVDNSTNISILQLQVDINENHIHNLISKIATLKTGLSIVEVIDPCGDGRDVDEIVLKMNNGDIVGVHKNLGLRVLENGNYRTTDKQKCKYSVNNGSVTF